MNDISRKNMFFLSFLLGLGMLIYGNFLICFSVIFLSYLHISFVEKKNYSVQEIAFTLLYLIIFVFPTLFWILILKLNGITYYNHELVVYKQLIWIIETLNQSMSVFLQTAETNISLFFQTINSLYAFILFLIITISIWIFKNTCSKLLTKETKILLLNLFCFALFFIILGFYDQRLTFTLMPILLCISIAYFTNLYYLKKIQFLIFIIACIWHYLIITTYGPFS